MARFLQALIALPLLAGVVLFTLNNEEQVPVTLNPFEAAYEMPLYIICLLFLSGGFIFGSVLTWLSDSDIRKDRRAQKKKVKKLEKKLNEQQERLAGTPDHIAPGSRLRDQSHGK